MKKTLPIVSTLFVALAFILPANALEYKFATAEEAAEILATDDNYFDRMSAAEIAIRLKSETPDKTVADIKSLYRNNVLDWSDEEKAEYQAIIDASWDKLQSVAHLLPETVYLIRANDNVEGGLPHTRANAIILQNTVPEGSAELLFHETFHVLSRNQLARHDSLYGLIGFKACDLDEPDKVSSIHLTNPDVPAMGWYLPVAGEEGDFNIVPFLFATTPAFSPEIGAFPGHFGFGLLKVGVVDGVCTPELGEDGAPVLLDPGTVPGFFAAIGGNTQYIIHAEEVLADNFTFLMTGKTDLPNPEILERLNAWLMEGM